MTKVFAFSSSILKPFEKSLVPCSKRTTKQNAKKTKSTNQKSPRRSDMRCIVTERIGAVNECDETGKVSFEG